MNKAKVKGILFVLAIINLIVFVISLFMLASKGTDQIGGLKYVILITLGISIISLVIGSIMES